MTNIEQALLFRQGVFFRKAGTEIKSLSGSWIQSWDEIIVQKDGSATKDGNTPARAYPATVEGLRAALAVL